MKKINEREGEESDSDSEGGAELRALASDEGPVMDGKYKKLMEMGFMKRAADQQRELAREEALNVLRELQAMEEGDDESEEEKSLRDPTDTTTSALRLEEATSNINKLMAETSSNALTLPRINSSVRVNGVVNISTKNNEKDEVSANPWLVSGNSQNKRKKGEREVQLYANIDALLEDGGDGGEEADRLEEVEPPPRKLQRSESSLPERNTTPSSDPSLIRLKDESAAVKKGRRNHSQAAKEDRTNQRDTKVEEPTKSNKRPETKSNKRPERKPLLMQRSQEDLVQIAFAGPDYEKDFEDMKLKAVDEELEIDGKIQEINAQGNVLFDSRC